MDLVFLGKKDAEQIGGEAGPNLRLCTLGRGKGKRTRGTLVPVRSPVEARDLARQYSACANAAEACSNPKVRNCQKPDTEPCNAARREAKKACKDTTEGASCGKARKREEKFCAPPKGCEKPMSQCDKEKQSCAAKLFEKSAFGRRTRR